jgi:glycosyltransferase involved in cell wall biosynthesis
VKPLIFNIVASNVRGGMESVFVNYAQILKDSDFEVICLSSSNFPYNATLDEEGIKRISLNIKGHFDIFAAIKLLKLIKKHNPKLIIAHNGRVFALLNLIKKFSGHNFKIIGVSHGGSLKRLLKFDGVIGVAKHIVKNIKDCGFKGRVETIYNGVEVAKVTKKKSKNKDFTFGVMSRLSSEKNIEMTIEAFGEFVKKVNEDAKLVIAGEGDEKEALEKLVQELGIENKVKFIGWVSDKGKFFNEIDIFVQSSIRESFGITIIESFNYLTPVISSNALGPKEIIKDGKNGFLFKLEKKNDLFLKMKKVFKEKDDLEKITKQAYRDLTKKFSFDKMADSLKSVINAIL